MSDIEDSNIDEVFPREDPPGSELESHGPLACATSKDLKMINVNAVSGLS